MSYEFIPLEPRPVLGTVPARLLIHVKTRGGESGHALPALAWRASLRLVQVREVVVQFLVWDGHGLGDNGCGHEPKRRARLDWALVHNSLRGR